MEVEATGELLAPVPRPRVFPASGGDQAPGPRCGHTLTTITGPDGDINRAKLVLFGERAVAQLFPFIEEPLLLLDHLSPAPAPPRPPLIPGPTGGATALEGSTAKNPDGTTSSPASPSPAGESFSSCLV